MARAIDEFFQEFRREITVQSQCNGNFQQFQFMETFAEELIETGFIDNFDLCYYAPELARKRMRVDGYCFSDEGGLTLFIGDFDQERDRLAFLSKTEMRVAFMKLSNFFQACAERKLTDKLEITTPEYDLAKQIVDRDGRIESLDFVLLSERALNGKVYDMPSIEVMGLQARCHIWDIERLYRQRKSRSHRETLDIDFKTMFGKGISTLPIQLSTTTYQSHLMAMPGAVLADLYECFGARLLEQNVRTFLQARGAVNKGIRKTIREEPEMFFAYNNGIAATAKSVELEKTDSGMMMIRVVDLQIVNGGQTTASLFHTRKRDRADLSEVFVQMKLSVIDDRQSETVVSKISEYANTQNKVNVADFFSNHPFHIRMEEFSRKILTPASRDGQPQSKWFYERTRGQYADAQSILSSVEKKRFKMDYPKNQMFSKIDLAKFENVWDDHPKWVNLGAQKNFSQYAQRIGEVWRKSANEFDENYFKRAVVRCIVFRAAEKIVSKQPWFRGGYRANIVAYTLALLAHVFKQKDKAFDFDKVWIAQQVDAILEQGIAEAAKLVHEDILQPPAGAANISEWCKKEACWERLKLRADDLIKSLPSCFFEKTCI